MGRKIGTGKLYSGPIYDYNRITVDGLAHTGWVTRMDLLNPSPETKFAQKARNLIESPPDPQPLQRQNWGTGKLYYCSYELFNKVRFNGDREAWLRFFAFAEVVRDKWDRKIIH